MEKRVIAIHLPQFYPFKENDEWWGKGFTEWRNVTKAKPRFWKHYQPHLPADLGFYDLRLKECRLAQIELAKEHGIYGFCYYHYWFNGKLIMEKPVEAMLQDPDEDFPFMFCWANENWSRNWEGGFNVILIKQDYSEKDDIEHFYYLLPYFKDSRYIRIDNKPVFAIYRTTLFPDIEKTIQLWQSLAEKEGFQLYICRFEAVFAWGKKYMKKGIDAAIEFQPMNMEGFGRYENLLNSLSQKLLKKVYFSKIYSYKAYVDFQCKKSFFNEYKRYPCVCPSWDNSPRRVNRPFLAFKGSTPHIFEKWFKHVYNTFQPFSKDENLIFINAWNEWAEGNHLEPDLKFGRGYLEAVKNVINMQ
ncbi:glycoside hydrolase family 99-like domain-containing protein [uncultured Bacteroides sp.]|uniref:glycosyltransferase WbsX family protein n=1 Tax=uncultured Bacteroides sp. TaxID=162156 RepID=UPI002602990F|nr:glycoside hydrolase family 99-like domain-containing protein [uncultured Bacteroides sp.]